MRLSRVLVISALTGSAAIAAPIAAGAVPTPPYTVVTMGGPVSGGDTGGTVLDASNSTITFANATAAGPLQFDATPTGSTEHTVITINPPQSASLAAISYVTAKTADATNAGLDIAVGANGCGSATGTLDISQLDADAGDQHIVAFAAGYTFTCDGAPAFSGELRWQSTTDYSALTTTPASWDFGDQVIKVNGPAKTFTFHNRGSLAVNFGTAPTVSGATTGFSLAADTCYPHSIAVGTSCSITVVPHPQFAVSSTYSGSVGVLHLIPDGLPDQAVQLREEGRKSYSIWLQPGPSRIRFNWGQLPGTIGASLVNYTVYRGTSATNLMPLRQVAAGVMTTVDNSVTPGRVYYYAVQPNYTDQSGGKSPRVAAEAWPKYSSGMYHRLATPARLLSSHSVNAGHPYSLKVLGGHGIPGSHVSAVALNVTAAKPSQTTSVTVYPGGSNRPAQSDLTLAHGSTRSNFALVKVGSTGRITISTSHGTTPVTVDVSGYYSATGLSATYGTGAAGHTFVDSSWILDTKRQGFGPLPHDYYIDAPVDFDPLDTPHITSLAVRITAYGSTGSGSIAAYATGGRLPATSVLSYSANSTTSNYAIVSAGRFFGNNGQPYPSIAFLNRGARPVHLIVTITGYYDDDTFWFGERYTPTAPVHLGVANPLYAGGLRTISPGNHAHTWTAAMNLKIAASAPTATTTLALWPRGISGIGAPAHGQLHANAHQSTVASTPVAVGIGNRFFLRNAAGRTSVNLWSFGTFEAWPAPSARSYASDGTVSAGTPRSAPGPLRTAHHPVRLR